MSWAVPGCPGYPSLSQELMSKYVPIPECPRISQDVPGCLKMSQDISGCHIISLTLDMLGCTGISRKSKAIQVDTRKYIQCSKFQVFRKIRGGLSSKLFSMFSYLISQNLAQQGHRFSPMAIKISRSIIIEESFLFICSFYTKLLLISTILRMKKIHGKFYTTHSTNHHAKPIHSFLKLHSLIGP